MVRNGSRGICERIGSTFVCVMICVPTTNPAADVVTEDPSWYHRRDCRSLKKVFQLSAGSVLVVDVDSEVGVEVEGEVLTFDANLHMI